jgi:pyruvate ferredoxin oxidoreductase alpha subunit
MKPGEDFVFVTGNEAVARAAKAARPDVIAAYPITPQTEVVEVLARFVESGELKAEYIHVESEHSALAACIGAASAGGRVFTATSSQGLLYMAEMVHWASIARLPIVMPNANRALAPGWNIWADHKDALSLRDAGWIQFFVSSVQEAYDTTLMAFRIAEDERVMLPVMVNLEAFVLSHIMQPLKLVNEEEYYGGYLPPINIPHALNFENVHTLGTLISPQHNYLMQHDLNRCMMASNGVIRESEDEFEQMFHRRYKSVMKYRCDDADTIIVAMGTLAKEAEAACDALREKGKAVGVMRIRQFRPFPEEVVETDASQYIILDRDNSPGCGGILAQEVKAKLYDAHDASKEVFNCIAGLGGQDVSYEMIEKMVMRCMSKNKDVNEKEKHEKVIWWGV